MDLHYIYCYNRYPNDWGQVARSGRAKSLQMAAEAGTEQSKSPETLPTGTVTFLFSDIEGSTQRWEQHREAMQEALQRHDALLRSAIDAHSGQVFKTVGDAFCAVFRTAPEAIAAALAAQRAI